MTLIGILNPILVSDWQYSDDMKWFLSRNDIEDEKKKINKKPNLALQEEWYRK